jgi:hypothetical protein
MSNHIQAQSLRRVFVLSGRGLWRSCLRVRLIASRKIEQNRDMDRRDLLRELHLRQFLGGDGVSPDLNRSASSQHAWLR